MWFSSGLVFHLIPIIDLIIKYHDLQLFRHVRDTDKLPHYLMVTSVYRNITIKYGCGSFSDESLLMCDMNKEEELSSFGKICDLDAFLQWQISEKTELYFIKQDASLSASQI